MSSTPVTAYNILSPDVVVITLQKLQDFLTLENKYKNLLIENKKAEYKAKKKKRKTQKLSKGLPPVVNAVVSPEPPLPPAQPKKALPKPKPVVKREKINCGKCNKLVSKSHVKRHQASKKCLAATLTQVELTDVAEAVSPPLVLNEDDDGLYAQQAVEFDDMIDAYA